LHYCFLLMGNLEIEVIFWKTRERKKQVAEITGTLGNDTLFGTSESDLIKGLGGDDIIDGAGSDTIYAGDGDDHVLIGRTGAPQRFSADGGAGYDILGIYTGAITDSSFALSEFLQGGSVVDGFESVNIQGSEKDETIRGSYFDENIYGGSGNDRLFGEGGDDFLSDDAGDNWLSGGDGNDTLFFGIQSNADLFHADGGAGSDRVT